MNEDVKPTEQLPEEHQKGEVAPEAKEVVAVAEDRSAFNCPACNGDGLVLDNNVHKLCPQCGGTGKVS